MFGRQSKGSAMAKALPAGTTTMDVRPAAPAHVGTYFDESSQFTGSLKLNKAVHIDGSIEGDLDCTAAVTIGTSGKVTARIRAESVLIDGEVHGDIEARSEITLRKTARVYGDMKTEGIVIERGAKVEGQITIGPSNAVASTLAMPKPTPAPAPKV
ncbi:MAG TPA: polymer-forming cytoskeletal protein [Myxococcota bacterium]|nr:polymer-forming cytoskeletal protein [Myxococcota bacterium]